ncbi:NlpC/P60 family protein [Aliikangiella sp. G2MR2-5]|uniref:NlpC/P60 family protein n=1 Tax=Aliikangiella sp. G2MR2-5 TaxID=2788943 RepID=UPI0018A957EB|nr:NlpC/P60 family protein [Aliikangiella sp. G2MR2-5]
MNFALRPPWLLLLLFTASCSHHPPRELKPEDSDRAARIARIRQALSNQPSRPSKMVKATKGVSQKQQSVKQRLLRQYSQWQGTPYRLGGSSKKGIDCSAFVQIVMQKGLSTHLPRTTIAQSRFGRLISHAELSTGDLVFFKTTHRVRHVGIYLGEQKFMHASTSSGVMISRMDDIYWRQRYWMSRRIL